MDSLSQEQTRGRDPVEKMTEEEKNVSDLVLRLVRTAHRVGLKAADIAEDLGVPVELVEDYWRGL